MLPKKGVRSRNLERLFLCTESKVFRKEPLKAVQLCLICFSGLFFTSSSSLADVIVDSVIADNACNSEYIDEITTIRSIHDGDTLHLHDGRKIRLIGINTPELARKKNGRKTSAEPFAHAAKKALKRLFKNDKTISLRYGEDNKDRYGRYLAHGFLADGQNIQAILLNQGLANALNVPPNTQFSACYLAQEFNARCKKMGLWQRGIILQAKNLKNKHTGFHLIQGNVTKIRNNKKGIWLTLDHKLTVGIRSDDQFLFDIKTTKKLINQSVTVRGWVNKSKRSTPFYMRVRHPLSIRLSEDFSCS